MAYRVSVEIQLEAPSASVMWSAEDGIVEALNDWLHDIVEAFKTQAESDAESEGSQVTCIDVQGTGSTWTSR